MKHLLRMLSKTAMRQKALMLAACVVLGSASAWAAGDYAFVAWDETSGTLYFDCYELYEGVPEVPTVGATWTTRQDETITISKLWLDDEVLGAGETPGWVTDDIQNACVKVVIGSLGDRDPRNLQKWFYNFKNLTSIEGLTNLKTRDVKSMANMFEGCAKLTSLELIGLDTRNVEDMTRMFSGCAQLSVLYLSTFDTSKLRYIEGMFTNCTSLKTIYVDESLWTTDNVLDGVNLFGGCTSLVGGNKYAYNEASTGLSYAHVDKSDNPGYLTIGSVFAGWNGFDKELTFGFGDVPKLNAQNDEGVFQKIWYGKEVIDCDWATDEVQTKCTKVYFATSFNSNAKGLNMSFWFTNFSKLETVARIEYPELGNTDYMFQNCPKLSSITLPTSLKRIGDSMFNGCSSLSEIFIPKGVTSIGSSAFYDCTSLAAFTVSKYNTRFSAEDGVLFNADKTTLLIYPQGKTDGEYTVPDGVQTIGGGAFYEQKYLWYVILPSSVTAIESYAFFHCEKLEYVYVYAKTPFVISDTVFEGISKTCWLYVPSGNLSAYQNAAGWDKFSRVFGLSIGYAIWDEKAKTLYFDTDHTEEAPEAGSRWLTSSGRQVRVTKVWSGNEVEKTSSEDFPGWRQEGIMDVCKKVVFEGHISPKNCHAWFDGFEQLTEIEGLHYLLTCEVTDMSNMFSGCSQLRLGKDLMCFHMWGVTNMSGMFSGCSQLTELYLGSFNTSKVCSTAKMFSGCTNLKTIYVDDSWWDMRKVTDSSQMFYGCNSLIGGNGTSFDGANDGVGYARVDKSGEAGYLTAGTLFAVWCEGNSTLTFDFGAAPAEDGKYGGNTATKVYKGDNIVHFIYAGLGDSPWGNYGGDDSRSCTRAVITSSFAEHMKGLDMSYWFAGLEDLVLVQGLENVEVGGTADMFYVCRNLSSITLPATLKEIGVFMFGHCSSLSSIVIPDGVTTIGEAAFYQCESLTSINIPKSVTSIGERAFDDCASLAAFSVDAGNTHFASVDGVLFNADKTTLVAYPIGNTATEYTIPKGVQRIGADAFTSSPYLTSVSLPSSLIAIDNYAFFDCNTLSAVKSYAKTPPIKANHAFEDFADNAVLYVLRGCKSAYESAGWNSIFKTIVEFDMLPGDANGDGEVNAQDIVAVSNYIAGVSNVNIEVDAADVTGDGIVNIADVVAIVSLILSD